MSASPIQAGVVASLHLGAGRGQPAQPVRVGGVAAATPVAHGQQHGGDGAHPGATDADDVNAPGAAEMRRRPGTRTAAAQARACSSARAATAAAASGRARRRAAAAMAPRAWSSPGGGRVLPPAGRRRARRPVHHGRAGVGQPAGVDRLVVAGGAGKRNQDGGQARRPSARPRCWRRPAAPRHRRRRGAGPCDPRRAPAGRRGPPGRSGGPIGRGSRSRAHRPRGGWPGPVGPPRPGRLRGRPG